MTLTLDLYFPICFSIGAGRKGLWLLAYCSHQGALPSRSWAGGLKVLLTTHSWMLTESSFWYCRHLRDSERSIPTSAQTQNAQTQWNLQNSQNSSIPGSPCFQTHQTYHTPCALLHPGCDSIGCACTPPLTRTPLPMGGFSSKERTEQGHLHRETKADSPLFSSDLR